MVNRIEVYLSTKRKVLVMFEPDFWAVVDADGNIVEEELTPQETMDIEMAIDEFLMGGGLDMVIDQ